MASGWPPFYKLTKSTKVSLWQGLLKMDYRDNSELVARNSIDDTIGRFVDFPQRRFGIFMNRMAPRGHCSGSFDTLDDAGDHSCRIET